MASSLKGAVAIGAAMLLLAPARGSTHVIPAPAFVTAGEPSPVAFDVVNERAGRATVTLDLTPPAGVEITPDAPPPGWSASIRGTSVRWSGGRITGAQSLAFAATVTASKRAGIYSFTALQRYDDGRTVRWKPPFSVLPATGDAAPKQRTGRAIVAGVAGLVVVAATLLGLHVLRRRGASRR